MPFGTSRIWSASPPLLAMKVPPEWPSGLNCGGGLRVCFFCMSNSGPFRSASFNKHFPFTWQANQSLHYNYRSTKQQGRREGAARKKRFKAWDSSGELANQQLLQGHIQQSTQQPTNPLEHVSSKHGVFLSWEVVGQDQTTMICSVHRQPQNTHTHTHTQRKAYHVAAD